MQTDNDCLTEAVAVTRNAETTSAEADEDGYAETLVKRPADVPRLEKENNSGSGSVLCQINSDENMRDSDIEGTRQTRPEFQLENIVPLGLESEEKILKIKDSSHIIFSGRFDAAAVCGLLGTLEEADLRSLREHLHAALPDAIPATAGRQLARRNAGSSARLVDDCWALGYSIVNDVLTSHAHSTTLRPIGRNPLEPLPPPSLNVSAITNSMEGLVSSQLRLEGSCSGQQRDIARIRAELGELRDLRDEVAGLRELRESVTELRAAVSDRDARITHLEAQVAELLASAATAPTRQPISSPRNRQLASEMAGLIDVKELGASIAAALRSGAGDSDSDVSDDPDWPSLPPRVNAGARRRDLSTPGTRAQQHQASDVPNARQWADAVAMSRAPSGVAAATAVRQEGRHRHTVMGAAPQPVIMTSAPAETVGALPFLLEGIRPETADVHVRNLVLKVTTSLQNFQRVKRHSGARRGLKAFRFDVDARDAAVVMSPSSWPAGLRVRPWTVKSADRQLPPVTGPVSGQSGAPKTRQPTPTVAPSVRQLGAAQRPPSRPLNLTEGPAAARLNVTRQSGIVGSGPTSELVITETPDASSPVLIDGFHPSVSDAQVRNLVWPLVRNLHQCHEARHGGAQPGAKAYRIVVDSADGPAILNPVNWPAGLRVRAWPGQHTRPF